MHKNMYTFLYIDYRELLCYEIMNNKCWYYRANVERWYYYWPGSL